ncbi:cyclodeaminase/cyclohydrolase family protein [Halomicroarcula limicola]|uniref:Cyclodeaminase/cyclohydrolase family protein n=1 Tax=Haloarcula limicola TaxID=1429915 RepID=A0A8J8C8L7_9EURY|nr:cyclodeaminase/cyclohydrolase family protein [Halomicroarcula limicola]MBV0926203.1 cyclodeaminase/cyclohydrolase family protein [Halomicroarcula limicola]
MSDDRIADRTIDSFLSGVAASAVAPSAGAVAAVTGSMGAALCEMVAIHTSEPTASLTDARHDLAADREQLLELADADAAAVDTVQTAFEDGSETDYPQAALQRATTVPLRIAEACATVAEHAVAVAEEGTRNAVVDVAVGARIARTALASAATIVRENLDLIDDESFVADARRRLDDAEEAADTALTAVAAGTGIEG